MQKLMIITAKNTKLLSIQNWYLVATRCDALPPCANARGLVVRARIGCAVPQPVELIDL